MVKREKQVKGGSVLLNAYDDEDNNCNAVHEYICFTEGIEL